MPSMEPLPETVEAVDEFDPGADDGELLPGLLGLALEAEEDVPALSAVSLTRVKEDLTFTMVATAEEQRAHAVRSTLTLPILAGHEVVETVTLYATSEAAFVGHHERLADIFGAWAGGAVTNADLSFRSREEARQAPGRLRDRMLVDVAIGVLAARHGTGVDEAEQRLREASSRAGLTPLELARRIVRPGHRS